METNLKRNVALSQIWIKIQECGFVSNIISNIKELNGRANIVNCSSSAGEDIKHKNLIGLGGMAEFSPYCCSKWWSTRINCAFEYFKFE